MVKKIFFLGIAIFILFWGAFFYIVKKNVFGWKTFQIASQLLSIGVPIIIGMIISLMIFLLVIYNKQKKQD